jgi:flagellar assembly protein FliH
MPARAKYLFDVDFAAGAKPKVIALAEHQAQLSEAETRGYRTGFAAAEAEARASDARRLATAIEAISQQLVSVAQALALVENRIEAEAVDVAVNIGRKLAPELIAREPFAEIAALVTDCLRHLIAAPHVVVRVNEAIYPQAREQLDEIARKTGFEGRLVVLGDPAIGQGDCRIEWADGGMTRDRALVDAAIAETVARYLAGRLDSSKGEP